MQHELDILTIAPQMTALGVGLGIGLLVGLERERAKDEISRSAQAGVRTFALLGLSGVVAAFVGVAGICVGGFFLAVIVAANYLRTRGEDETTQGFTTEVAMLITFLLGILAASSAALAGGIGVAVTTILASRATLHRFARQWLSEQELHDLLILAVSAFVILPLLPDRTVDPWDSINPRRLWLLVVAVMSIASAGYLVLRTFGSTFGLAVAGLAGGFASSTATVIAMGDRAKDNPALAPVAASAAIMSYVGSIVQLAVVIGSLVSPLLERLTIPLIVAGLTAAAASVVIAWRSAASSGDVVALAGTRPFKPMSVFRFVLVLGGVLLLTAFIRRSLGNASLPWLMLLSGMVDVHAAAASAAQSVAAGQIGMPLGSLCVVIAFGANAVFKCVVATMKGGRSFAMRVVLGTLAIVTGFAVATALTVPF
jgi:uncharacterized membrane protein (DUF4010 family)